MKVAITFIGTNRYLDYLPKYYENIEKYFLPNTEKVILAYWDRYATMKRLGRKPTNEDRARIHNGGPKGHTKKATLKYWEKVKKALDKGR